MYLLIYNSKHKVYFVKYSEFHWYHNYRGVPYLETKGHFGIEKYANIWRDYYNGKINQTELRALLFAD